MLFLLYNENERIFFETRWRNWLANLPKNVRITMLGGAIQITIPAVLQKSLKVISLPLFPKKPAAKKKISGLTRKKAVLKWAFFLR